MTNQNDKTLVPVEYPKPSFTEQKQPVPSLASKMDLVPDNGETSYRGTGRLTGRKALITGGRHRSRYGYRLHS